MSASYTLAGQVFRVERTGGPCSALVCDVRDEWNEHGTLVVHGDYTASGVFEDADEVFVGFYAPGTWDGSDAAVRHVFVPREGDAVASAVRAILDGADSFEYRPEPLADPNGYASATVTFGDGAQ